MGSTRTNIVIDDEMLAMVMRRYGLSTKTEAVAMALKRLAGEPMTREEALAMRGAKALREVPEDTKPSDE
ncbi:MAG: type II toxin-antitoxin system VapB family antitoxin [Truepera sp.]|nr:type II toxin-antitoxin system VapB family antitoxin [Truepera sp.]